MSDPQEPPVRAQEPPARAQEADPPGDGLAPELTGVEAEAARFRPAASRSLIAGLVVIAVIVCAAVALPGISIQNKQAKLTEDLRAELELLSRSRAEVIATWLDGTARLSERIVESELVRLFATEMDLAGGAITDLASPAGPAVPDEGTEASAPLGLEEPSLGEQIPYMETVVTDFVRSVGFFSGHLVGRRQSVAYVTSAGAPGLAPAQIERAQAVLAQGRWQFGPARDTAQGLVIDLYAPVRPSQGESGSGKPIAVFLFTLPVAKDLTELLAKSPAAAAHERLRLIQFDGGRSAELVPERTPAVRPLQVADLMSAEGTIAFARRPGLEGASVVYSAGAAVADSGLWVIQEAEAEAAEAPLRAHIRTVVIVALLVVGAVVAAFGAFWWRLSSEHNKAQAAQFRHLAARIDAQKRLLDSINNTIADGIGLKDAAGSYRYINPAFARTLGREAGQIIGRDDEALFGTGTAQRLKISDEEALAAGQAVTVDEQVYIRSRKHHLQISKVPFSADGADGGGLVSVTRDVTDLVEQREKKERAIEQMVAALVRAVELRDPYLGGHSRRVAGLAKETAKLFGADAEVTATVEIAANLSQIGKLAVPREILTKPERLDAAEIEVVERHIEHARVVLQDIDFGLPVLDTIVQMHERLDGSGYPGRLAGAEITLAARILGACDVFCARVEPRSYRAGISAKEALDLLAGMPDRYDSDVISALTSVVGSVAGEKLLCGCDAA